MDWLIIKNVIYWKLTNTCIIDLKPSDLLITENLLEYSVFNYFFALCRRDMKINHLNFLNKFLCLKVLKKELVSCQCQADVTF